ncbi:MAG TPA: hypothetical protein VNZ45_15555, partial [Bacteroidia bacterium]|nr:hypothetical protein [Bacteroidia bacterium]
MEKQSPEDLILKLLKEKTGVQLDVREKTVEIFKLMKVVLAEVAQQITRQVALIDKRIIVQYKEKSEFEVNL